jgi:hypothetical protein
LRNMLAARAAPTHRLADASAADRQPIPPPRRDARAATCGVRSSLDSRALARAAALHGAACPWLLAPGPTKMSTMLIRPRSSDPSRAGPASAHELQRAAGAFQRDAGDPEVVDNLPITVAHVEEALDRLAVGMERMAYAVGDWSPDERDSADDDALGPDARALCWHLRTTARALRSSRDASAASREWARRAFRP